MPGPRPLPTETKRARGNPGKRPLNKREPRTVARRPPAPAVLDKVAKNEWNWLCRTLGEMGLLATADKGALAAASVLYSRWMQAEDEIKRFGLVVKSKTGFPIQSPWLGIANTALRELRAFWIEFGLTPSARTKVHAAPPPRPQSDVEAWMSLKGGR